MPQVREPARDKDIVTASDEPEHRRRARIRLELAVGYFEQGQTTIALDELKQSLAADPEFGDAYNLRGLVYMRLNDLPPCGIELSARTGAQAGGRQYPAQPGLADVPAGQARRIDAAFCPGAGQPDYLDRAKTLMTQGVCQMRANRKVEAEASLMQSFELDAGNPITEYNLALLLFQRGDLARAQFYIRRLNNSEWANSESLWLGIKVERKLGNRDAVEQLAVPLRKRFAQSREAGLYHRGAFDE